MQRGEGIIGDLGLRRRGRRKEGGLAGIGQADEAGVGDQLQPQPDPPLLALEAGIGAAGRLVGGGLELGVAEAAIAAFEQPDALAHLGQVGEDGLLVLVEDLGALAGTFSTTSAPLAPVRLAPLPWSPFLALKCCW